MGANYQWHQDVDASHLAEKLAIGLVAQINVSIQLKGSAVVALSGGSTPKPLFKALARSNVDWSKVVITLVDERWVPNSHELSNEAFMRRYLLDKLPSDVKFVPLYQRADSVHKSLPSVLADYCAQTNSSLLAPRAFDVVVLGMGGDGHTASFFPDADNIQQLVDMNSPDFLATCYSPSTQVARITWTLPMLLNTSLLALHITGIDKKAIFERASECGDSTQEICHLPIRCALFQDRISLNVYYAD